MAHLGLSRRMLSVVPILVFLIGCTSPRPASELLRSEENPTQIQPTQAASATAETTSAPATTPQPFAGSTAWIAYQTNRSGREGVWLIHPDGTADHQIAIDAQWESVLPDWSPDGARLVFATRGGPTEPLREYDLPTNTARKLFICEDPC